MTLRILWDQIQRKLAKMDITADVFENYPEYVPDVDNFVSPNCSYVNVENLSPLICG